MLLTLLLSLAAPAHAAPAPSAHKLYWFVPDGLRADPDVMDVFGWAKAGKLPNIKRMMDEGAWGYARPAFPSHTPSNFATLMTGSYPETHGVADGPMRVEGFPLQKPSVNGFSSTAKKTPPIWRTLEAQGRKVALVSIPGSTPPELDAGAVVRGRWGNWGADFHAINFQSAGSEDPRAKRGLGARLFYLGPELTRDVPLVDGVMTMLAYGATVQATLDPKGSVSFTMEGKTVATLSKSNEWTPWLPVTLKWQGQDLPTSFKLCLIKSGPGYLKVRWLFDVMNRTIVSPPAVADALESSVGPMIDFPDNWPAQLNRLPEEKDVLLTEAKMALDWHKRAAARLLSVEKPDVLIQDTYVPNQLLESRWWLKHLDPASPDYAATSKEDRAARAAELLSVYQGIDAVLGEALKNAGPDTVIALSSDHGILAIKREVLVNNLLAKEGLLTFSVDGNGEVQIDWAKSKAAFLKMIGVYVNPDGLAGPWKRGSGKDYDALRDRVAKLLLTLKDGDAAVVDEALKWEDADKLRLPKDRVPDLVLAMKPGYALTEDMDTSGEFLRASRQSGYKQAVKSDGVPALYTPFVVMGPGVKKGYRITTVVPNADQAPTLLTLIGAKLPEGMQGKPVQEMLK